MAEKRMFAKSIVLSDAFLDMPMSARCLYFTLGMLADDDGFVGAPNSIMRQCNATRDDMAVLLSKRFVISFDSGVIVIKHWRINNYLQNDRHKATTYKDELSTLKLESNGAYTEISKAALPEKTTDEEPVYTSYTECIQDVYIDKNSIDKNSLDKNSKEKAFERFWDAYPAGHKVGKQTCEKAFNTHVIKEHIDIEVLLTALEKQKRSVRWTKDNGQYIPNPATWINQGRWEDELEQVDRAKTRDIAVEDLPEIRRPNKE